MTLLLKVPTLCFHSWLLSWVPNTHFWRISRPEFLGVLLDHQPKCPEIKHHLPFRRNCYFVSCFHHHKWCNHSHCNLSLLACVPKTASPWFYLCNFYNLLLCIHSHCHHPISLISSPSQQTIQHRHGRFLFLKHSSDPTRQQEERTRKLLSISGIVCVIPT